MLDHPARAADATVAASAWRVEFVRDKDQRRSWTSLKTIEAVEPAGLTAVLTPLEAGFALGLAERVADDALTAIWLPPGVNAPSGIERDAERWFRAGGANRKWAIARADIRTVRVACDGRRALIYASPDDVDAALDAVVRFTVVERETALLEDGVRQAWPAIGADASLTHAVTRRDGQRQRHVNAMTVQAATMKMAWIRTTNALEQMDPGLTEASKRLFAELVSAAALYDRLELLEDPIQFAVDQYELANSRLIEAALSRKERTNAVLGFILEATIIALLALQFVHW